MAKHADQPTGAPSAGGAAHLLDLVRQSVPPLHPAGRPVVGCAAAVSLGARLLLRRVGWKRLGGAVGRTGLAGTALVALFFRAPNRVAPTGTGLVVAPADGLVALVDHAVPPVELGLAEVPLPRVSVFLSLLDVHVQRIPIEGVVTRIAYRAGTFLSADLDKASVDNERNSMLIGPAIGGEVVVTQIAGLLARRIVCDVRAGSLVHTGQTYGLIRFGSRVDTYLPAGTAVRVRRGQRTIGGETVLAAIGQD